MSTWLRPKSHTGSALTRQFAILSFIVIGLITTVLCVAISYYLRKDLLEREWGITADFIRTQARQYLTPSDFSAGSETARERFRNFYVRTVMMPEIIRVKIYDAAMTVIWSDEPRLIGQRFPDNSQLRDALAGQTAVNLDIGPKGENIYERSAQHLVEVYVPVMFPGHPRVLGVVEAYKEPTKVFANIRRGQITVVSTALAGGALLYLSLFWIVRRAARRLEAQHETLGFQSRELAARNQELLAVQAQLVETERMAAIGEVVAAVAHGIRNPLANIRASAQVALLDCHECTGSRLGPRSLTNVIAEADRLEGRLRELFRFVRPAERQSTPLDLNAVLRHALRIMAGRVTEAHLKVDEQFDPAVPMVMGDPLLLEQVFVNLIDNAVEATAREGTITVTTGATQDDGRPPQVFAEVRDTGSGIPPEQISKIFDLFHTTKAQGTGLGLAIAKKFTEAHGGTISVQSRPGEGATFRVTLPARPKA